MKNNEINFMEFFRTNCGHFSVILNLLRNDLTVNSTFFIRKPILPERKLFSLVVLVYAFYINSRLFHNPHKLIKFRSQSKANQLCPVREHATGRPKSVRFSAQP